MSIFEHPTVWQLLAAFASDDYELREIATGEFELIAIAHETETVPGAHVSATESATEMADLEP